MERRGFLRAIAGAAASVAAIALPTPKAKAKPPVAEDDFRIDAPLVPPACQKEYTTAYTTRMIYDCTRVPDQFGLRPTLVLRALANGGTEVTRGPYVASL